VTGLDHDWHLPPPDLALPSEEVHVWQASLNQPPERVRELGQTLSHDEMMRAERFRFERDRRRFIVGRGVLRAILFRYLGIEPEFVQFRYGSRGKPYLAEKVSSCGLRFSLAHSHELALYAFTRDREVGVDLEYVRPMPDAAQIAARFFSAREHAVFCALPKGQKLEAFYSCWTRKEAYLKATGEGLARPLDQFDVSLVPGDPAGLLRVQGDSQEIARWSLQALAPGTGYVAAIAVEGHGWCLACWQWPGKQAGRPHGGR
jgi:4'-phosphopantetheinyl transferase